MKSGSTQLTVDEDLLTRAAVAAAARGKSPAAHAFQGPGITLGGGGCGTAAAEHADSARNAAAFAAMARLENAVHGGNSIGGPAQGATGAAGMGTTDDPIYL